MPSGILGAASLAASTHTTLSTVPAGRTATLVINACNRNATAVKLRLALAAGATPSASEWIEYDTELAPYGVLERSAIVLEAGKRVVAYASTANVTVMAYGLEE